MNRKLKTLGFALVAALALTAGMASAASAQFTSNKEHTLFSGSQEGTHTITFGEGFGGFYCETVVFGGTVGSKNAVDLKLSATYANCKSTWGPIHVDNQEFAYTFTTDGTVHVSGTLTLTVTNGGPCTIVFKSPQTNSGITYDNLGGTSGIRLTTRTTDFISTTTGGFFYCGIQNGEHPNGTYHGATVIAGKDTSGAAASISVD